MQSDSAGKQSSEEELHLLVFAGDQVAKYPLPGSGSLSIGRAEDNDVRIDNSSVSRKHCVLHVGPPLAVEDLGGANGTFVRERRERAETNATHDLRMLSGQTVAVGVGDCVNVGTTTLVVRRAPKRVTAGPPAAVVRAPAMQAIYAQAERAAKAPISVLLLGETGVGKDVLARHVHASSPRADRPFLGLNCASLADSLLEGELFGHEKGAFTGALQTRPGLFESAKGGTVFLDEVGELPMSMQAKLLRVLEDKKVMRVGGRTAIDVDVRFVAATNRDLEAASTAGSFRQDLYFRLNGISITLPPLRERRSEIVPLAELFIDAACRQMDQTDRPTLSPEAVKTLEQYDWPGNVRELRNVMERAVVLSTGDLLHPADFPPAMVRGPQLVIEPSKSPTTVPPGSLRDELEVLERHRILAALEKCGGNQTHAAELLGMSRRTLVSRLSEYDLPRPRRRT